LWHDSNKYFPKITKCFSSPDYGNNHKNHYGPPNEISSYGNEGSYGNDYGRKEMNYRPQYSSKYGSSYGDSYGSDYSNSYGSSYGDGKQYGK
jgi:hypothetical protein